MSPRHLVLALAVLAAGCASKAGRPAPPENPKFTFPHTTHVEEGIKCVACHSSVAEATSVGPTVHAALPTGRAAEACLQCHEKSPLPPPPRQVEPGFKGFSHAQHLRLPKMKDDCRRCHTALTEPGNAKAPVPPMSACTSCHEHAFEYAQAKCQHCHEDLKRYPLKPVADYKHEGDFLRTHGRMARASATTCAACHDQTSCAECHAATTRPLKPDVQWPERVGASFVHRGDYVSRHVIEFRHDPASCRRCHGSAYCDACHQEQGISQRSVSAGGRAPHPPGWGAGVAHGSAARRDILSCAACHDQGARSNCVACHKTVKPHPAGWGQRHNRSSDVARNSMCRNCHAH